MGVNFQSQFSALSAIGLPSGAAAWQTASDNPFNGGGAFPTATSSSSSGSNSGSNGNGNSGSSGDGTSTPDLFTTSKSSGTPKHIILAIVLPIALIIAAAIFFVTMWVYYRRKRTTTPALQQKADIEREKPTEYYKRDSDPVR